jgi:hypothetical protein
LFGHACSAAFLGGLYAMGQYPTFKAFAVSLGVTALGNAFKGFRYRSLVYKADKAVVFSGQNSDDLISAITKIEANQNATLLETCRARRVPMSKIAMAYYRAGDRLTGNIPGAARRTARIEKAARRYRANTPPADPK